MYMATCTDLVHRCNAGMQIQAKVWRCNSNMSTGLCYKAFQSYSVHRLAGLIEVVVHGNTWLLKCAQQQQDRWVTKLQT